MAETIGFSSKVLTQPLDASCCEAFFPPDYYTNFCMEAYARVQLAAFLAPGDLSVCPVSGHA